MKLDKRILALVLTMGMLLMCMAGCAGSQDANGSDASNGGKDSNDAPTIKIGYVAPFTGVNSDCVTSTYWGNDLFLEQINDKNGGIYIEEYGQKVKVEIIYRDSQSDAATAGEVATQLVLNEEVDLLVGAWTPNTTVPVAAVAERYSVPCICPNSPAEAWKGGLEEGDDYEWCVGIMFALPDFIGEVINLWDTLEFNKKVGLMLDNGADGATAATIVAGMADARGYETIDPGRFPTETNDYSAMINLFKSEGAEVIYGSMTTANFATFWKQCAQLDYTPLLVTGGLACHYDNTVETIDEICGAGAGLYVSCESFWCPAFGYGDDYLDMTADELVALWESDNKTQAPEDMGFTLSCAHLIQEVFTQAGTVDKETVRDTLRECEINSLFGPQACDGNVYFTPIGVVQWVEGDDWKYEPNVISASTMPQVKISEYIDIRSK